MTKKTFFSIIITVYKNFEYIEEAVRSVINQDYNYFEVIIVDTFYNRQRENKFKKKFRKNKINFNYLKFHNKFRAAGARNYGVNKSSGEYIVFLDDDDKFKKNYLKNLNKVIIKKRYDLLVSEFSEFSNNKILKRIEITKKFNIHDLYVYNPFVLPSNIAIKKETFLFLKGFNTNFFYSSDKLLLIDIIKEKKSYHVLKKNLVLRRVHKKNWTKNYKIIFENNLKFFKNFIGEFILITKIRFLKKLVILYLKYVTTYLFKRSF
tara:strand:+ start:628 stop:1416 length:789 start_codon:yes stop_codon:yes gene_type:complete